MYKSLVIFRNILKKVLSRDFVEISHDTYKKLYELKFSMQPVKIICRPKMSGVSKEEGNGVVTKKGRASVGKIEGA